MKNLRLRTKLWAIAVPPLAILAVLVAYALNLTYVQPGSVDPAAIQSDLRTLGLVGLAGVLGSALLLVLVTRNVTGPLDRLTRAADDLSTRRLPALVELLRDPTAVPPARAEPLELHSDDELGRLARALELVQAVAAEVVATQQRLVHHGLTTPLVNLARRNQTLLERQLALIDQLETSEPDPARLEDLYQLDHLATRMRRNAESLLVLSGAEPARRRREPVQVADVVRVATGEIEDYRRVEIGDVGDVQLEAAVAVDLAHLLSELLENATQFSPPDSPVVIEGRRDGDDTYRITVVDQGIGMGDEARAEANRLLDQPPELGPDPSRSLGFLVVGRLAKRLGATVALHPSPGQGLTAVVGVPGELVLSGGDPSQPSLGLGSDPEPGWSPPEALRRPRPAPGPAPATDVPGPGGRSPVPPPAGAGHPPIDPRSWWGHPSQQGHRPSDPPDGPTPREPADAPDRLVDALPEGDAFDQGLSSLITAGGPSTARPPIEPPVGPLLPVTPFAPAPPAEPVRPPKETVTPPGEPGSPWPPTEGDRPAEAAEPASPADRTPAGPVRRQRGANAPAEGSGGPVTASSRSPEEIRQMLARYRSGIKHRRPTTDTPADEESTP